MRSMIAATACALTTLALAPAALAQTPEPEAVAQEAAPPAETVFERMLVGQSVLRAPEGAVPGCDPAMVTENSATALGLDFVCRRAPGGDAAAEVPVGVGVVILTRALVIDATAFLVGQTESWWPETTAEEREQRLASRTIAVEGGDLEFVCASREAGETPAMTVCVRQGELVQMLVSGRSATVELTDAGIGAVLGAFHLTPGPVQE